MTNMIHKSINKLRVNLEAVYSLAGKDYTRGRISYKRLEKYQKLILPMRTLLIELEDNNQPKDFLKDLPMKPMKKGETYKVELTTDLPPPKNLAHVLDGWEEEVTFNDGLKVNDQKTKILSFEEFKKENLSSLSKGDYFRGLENIMEILWERVGILEGNKDD